ncbi:molybdopterin molybdotransferase MoeA [Robiginitalea sp.]|uniref:molybdopterin molybdotransferase MoeA n=1 Tax=Robiginitalea sp. TaxID=1902411 RepID=UPI003C76A082
MENVFIKYEKALSILAAHSNDFPDEERPLNACIGAHLAEDLLADRDFPPFDRVTMDGISLSYEAFANGQREFPIEAVAPAGTPKKTLQNSQNCIEVMTGAIMPAQTDTVIRYEDLEIVDGKARVMPIPVKPRQNIHFKGIDRARGSVIVQKGKQLSSAEINIAAAVGKSVLRVKKMPRAVIISTGDELVDVHQTPELHQIRRSNIYGIQSTLKTWGIPADLRHLPDDRQQMLEIISGLLENYDLFIFTGGVSKGKFDYLPDVLETLQIEKHFHKIQQRPGKPFWFGTSKEGKKIFALPGNPVSSFVCVYIYLRFWLYKSLGLDITPMYVSLKNDITFTPDLVYFLEARLESNPDGTLQADPISGNGSGDFANLVKTDGFLVLPQNKSEFKQGEVYLFVPYRDIF